MNIRGKAFSTVGTDKPQPAINDEPVLPRYETT